MTLRVQGRRASRRFLLAGLVALAPCSVRAEQAADASALGKQVFMSAQPACSVCHTLAAAGAAGTVGPNLDKLKPKEERVRAAVRDGVGVMPRYRDTLSKEEIDAVSEYVAGAAGSAE